MLSEVCYRYCLCQDILSNIFHVLRSYLFYLSMSQFHLDGEKMSELNISHVYHIFGELWTIDISISSSTIFILIFINFIMLRHINFIFIRVHFFPTVHIIVQNSTQYCLSVLLDVSAFKIFIVSASDLMCDVKNLSTYIYSWCS